MYHFTRDQLISLIDATIDTYLECRHVYGQGTIAAQSATITEMIDGIDADKELAANDPTEWLHCQQEA